MTFPVARFPSFPTAPVTTVTFLFIEPCLTYFKCYIGCFLGQTEEAVAERETDHNTSSRAVTQEEKRESLEGLLQEGKSGS